MAGNIHSAVNNNYVGYIGAKVFGKQKIRGFSPYVLSTVYADDTLLVTVGPSHGDTDNSLEMEITVYDSRVPAKVIQLQRSVLEKRPEVWSDSNVNWDFERSSWISLGKRV